MKFKVGDKVQVLNYDEIYNKRTSIDFNGIWLGYYFFSDDMKKYCGKDLVVKVVLSDCYLLNDDPYRPSHWHDCFLERDIIGELV